MTVKTTIAKSYLGRLALIGLFCSGFGVLCVYDGVVGWPRQREQALLFQEYEKDSRYDEWREEVKKRGWPEINPGEPKTENDILGQFIMAGVTAPIGFIFLLKLLLNRSRWIEADATGLRTSSGSEFYYNQITVLNKKKWQKKGIAKLHYQADGREKKLTLDDYNYDRDTTGEILRMIEDNIDHAKITNGPPEPPPKPADTADDANAES